jgi:hypothetical protein
MNYLATYLAKFSGNDREVTYKTYKTESLSTVSGGFVGFVGSSPYESENFSGAEHTPRGAPPTPYWFAPNLSPDEVDDIMAIREWSADDRTSFAENLECGCKWNTHVQRSRRRKRKDQNPCVT